MRTNTGEYWIEPSNQLSTDSSKGRPHIIFRRSAVDKIEAFHREKRAAPNKDNGYQNPTRTNSYQNHNRNQNSRRYTNNRRNRLDTDKRRREFLERRRKRLEAMRKNPVEYRRHQTTLRIEDRRHPISKSNSVETSNSLEQYIERRNRQRIADKDNEHRMRRIRNRRQRKRRNCATKQPPYQWRTQNLAEQKALRNNMVSSKLSI